MALVYAQPWTLPTGDYAGLTLHADDWAAFAFGLDNGWLIPLGDPYMVDVPIHVYAPLKVCAGAWVEADAPAPL